MEIKSWLKNTGVGMVNNGFGHAGHGTLKSAVSIRNQSNKLVLCMLIQMQES